MVPDLHSPRSAPSGTGWLLAGLLAPVSLLLLAGALAFNGLVAEAWPQPGAESGPALARLQHQVLVAALGVWLLLLPVLWLLARRLAAPWRDLAMRLQGVTNTLDARVAERTEALARRNAELTETVKQLQRSELHNAAILQHAPDAFIGLDGRGVITAWNEEAVRTFGWQAHEALGQSMFELLTPPHDRVGQKMRLADLTKQTVGVSKAVHAEVLCLHRDGHLVPLHVSVASLVTESGVFAHAFAHDISERKKAERRLAESVHRLRLVANNTPALMLHVDTDLRFTFANERAREWFPTPDNSLAGKTIPEVMGEAIFRNVKPELERALAGQPVSFEREIAGQGEGGLERRYYLVHYRPDLDDDGKVQGIYGTALDITARRQAEVALLSSEQRLRDIADNVPAMIAYFDADLRCGFANAQSLAISGRPGQHVVGTPLEDVLGSRYLEYRPYIERALAGERTSFEGHHTVGNTRLDVHTHFMPRLGSDGRVTGFYVLAYDQTALKTAERRSAAGEQRLRTITDNLPVLIAYIDQDERYRFCNGTFKSWMGVEPDDMIGRTVADTLPPAEYLHRRPLLQRALSGQRTEFELESAVLGRQRQLQATYVPDVAADGSVCGLYALIADVTAMKQAERQLALMASTDALTGLPNRRALDSRLGDALARSRRSEQAVALLYLDIDHFKAINDSLGHAAGDDVLKVFSARLRACVREADTVVRLAGDEFVVLLEGLHSPDEPQAVARKILAAVNRPVTLDGGVALDLGTSIGIAYHAAGTVAAGELLATADKALYEAKAAGRNTFRWAST